MIKRLVFYLADPANSKKMKKLGYLALAVVVISDFLVHREHAVYLWDRIPGWSAFYGLFSCIVLSLFSKFIGHHGIMKDEDYYDD